MIWDMNWEVFLRLVLDYLRALLSTPVVVGAVIVFFLLKFKPGLDALLTKLASFKGPAGFELSFAADQAKATEDVKKIQEQAHVQVVEQQTHAPAAQNWENIAVEMGKWWAFERLFRSIYSSQIMLLRHLSTSPNQTARWSELVKFYQDGVLAKGVPAVQYPFENYMGFLRNAGLITWTLHPGAAEGDVTLTSLGQEFVNYLQSMNYNAFERPY